MFKQLLNKDKVCAMIRKCYESDPVLINNYHVLAGSPVNKCIYRTVLDFKKYNVDI